MTPRKSRISSWLAIAAGAALLLVGGVFALWEYMDATATPLHPDAAKVSMVAASAPSSNWSGAVKQAQEIARMHLVEKNLPGLSVAVGVGGDLVWAEGFGWADIDKQVAVKPETRFRIGTASVPLTSAAVGVLLEKQALSLDEKIQTYVPEFPQLKWPVTLRQAMAHTAGIVSDGGDEGELFSQKCGRPLDGLKEFKDINLLFEPGTKYRYSNYSWILVSAAVEAAAKQPFLAFMREHVFKPLGMDHTTTDDEQAPDRAVSYFPRFAADPHYGPDPMRDINLSCYAGASVFVSTPSDLVRFAMAVNGGKFLKPETVAMLQAPQKIASGEETGYSLGWDLETVPLAGDQTVWVGHDGQLLGGMVASLMTFRERGIVIAIISNTSYAKAEDLALELAQAFAEPVR